MKPSAEQQLQQAFAAARAGAAPSADDRARLDERLRALLGSSGALQRSGPALAGAAAGSSRVGAILGSGLVMGMLGLLVGYQLGLRAQPIPPPAASVAIPTTPPASVASAPALPLEPPAAAPLIAAPSPSANLPPGSAPGAGNGASSATHSGATVQRPPPAAVEALPARANTEWKSPPPAQAAGLRFADVVDRLRKANLALREGRPALALLQLAELDRQATGVLREEREVTRVLALCAMGDQQGAQRSASQLGAVAAQSIYAQRLKNSCVGVQR